MRPVSADAASAIRKAAAQRLDRSQIIQVRRGHGASSLGGCSMNSGICSFRIFRFADQAELHQSSVEPRPRHAQEFGRFGFVAVGLRRCSLDRFAFNFGEQLVEHDAFRLCAASRRRLRRVVNDRRQIGGGDFVRLAGRVGGGDHFAQFVQFAGPCVEGELIERIGAQRADLFAAAAIAGFEEALGQDGQIFQPLAKPRQWMGLSR